MPGLLDGKLSLVLGIANKWSLAHAIARALSREGADLVLTYLGEHEKGAVEVLAKDLRTVRVTPVDRCTSMPISTSRATTFSI